MVDKCWFYKKVETGELDNLVLDYYAPTIFLFHRYLVSGEITEDIKNTVNILLERHIYNFLQKYGNEV